MKKKLLTIITILLVLALALSCSNDQNKPPEEDFTAIGIPAEPKPLPENYKDSEEGIANKNFQEKLLTDLAFYFDKPANQEKLFKDLSDVVNKRTEALKLTITRDETSDTFIVTLKTNDKGFGFSYEFNAKLSMEGIEEKNISIEKDGTKYRIETTGSGSDKLYKNDSLIDPPSNYASDPDVQKIIAIKKSCNNDILNYMYSILSKTNIILLDGKFTITTQYSPKNGPNPMVFKVEAKLNEFEVDGSKYSGAAKFSIIGDNDISMQASLWTSGTVGENTAGFIFKIKEEASELKIYINGYLIMDILGEDEGI